MANALRIDPVTYQFARQGRVTFAVGVLSRTLDLKVLFGQQEHGGEPIPFSPFFWRARNATDARNTVGARARTRFMKLRFESTKSACGVTLPADARENPATV